jgi:putative membrane protein
MPANKSILKYTKIQIATAIAILFHTIGFAGILFGHKDFFIHTSALNLLLMFFLVIYTQNKIDKPFLFFVLICFFFGILAEIIGTQTSLLFGKYSYGNALGPKLYNVPLVIGLNWFIIIFCCGITIETILFKLTKSMDGYDTDQNKTLKRLSVLFDGATIAVFFDWVMEPVAVKLNFWKWEGDGSVPFYNYVCWFLLSMIFLFFFRHLQFDKRNKFAVHLLLIQTMFFLLLRTFL